MNRAIGRDSPPPSDRDPRADPGRQVRRALGPQGPGAIGQPTGPGDVDQRAVLGFLADAQPRGPAVAVPRQ